MEVRIDVMNGSAGASPALVESAVWTTERRGAPGKLTFTAAQDGKLVLEEGSAVRLTAGGKALFYGYIFTVSGTRGATVSVTAYDQTRYLLSRDTYVFQAATASGIIRMIAEDYGLRMGEIADTGYVIPARVLDGKTLLDMMEDALELTLANTRKLYCLYDDAGALTLSREEDMKVGLLLDAAGAEDLEWSSSIDRETYDVVKLVHEENGKRDVFVARDPKAEARWGSLQYFESVQSAENARAKAQELLKLYDARSQSLTVRNAAGDLRVRAGSLVAARLRAGGRDFAGWMLVDSCEHRFSNGRHVMKLKLRGAGNG